jgi:hypothetical protein
MKQLILSLTQRTAQILKTKQHELGKIVWKVSESNTDQGFSQLACTCCSEAWIQIQKEQPLYKNTTLRVSIPDINLVFNHNGEEIHGKIELKSGLSEEIPGSTIMSLDINQPTIFCLRPKKGASEYKFRYSQYYSSMILTDNDCFQDRSPRPKISFKKMVDCDTPVEYVNKEKMDWNPYYAKCAIKRVYNNLNSWQDTLTSAIIDCYLKTTPLDQIIERHKLLESAEPSSQ